MKLRQGMNVLIRFKGREVEGRIVMASENGKSLALSFDAMLGGYVGTMLVVDLGDGYRDLIGEELVEIEPLQ